MHGCCQDPADSPEFGLTSKSGKWLLEISKRSRWPRQNRLVTGNSSLHRRKHSPTARHREDYNAVRFATAARDWVADGFGDLGYDIAGFHQSQMRRHSRRGEAIEHGDVVHGRRT
jgi:hypothetical protein